MVGPGAREHALVRSLATDPGVTGLFAAPGNPGIAGLIGERNCFAVDALDPAAVTGLAGELGADLVVVGPEAPLVAGVSDAVRAAGIPCFGPSAAAARLEGSKAFAKDVMAAAGVPTGESATCATLDEVREALVRFGAPHVVKDDGLAAGKGVVVTDDPEAALAHAAACLEREGARVVIEEFLDGPEVSLFCVTDGVTVLPLEPAQDFKRALDGDLGPNTGGMGAYSPLPWAPEGLVDEVLERVARPTVAEMARRGAPFVGVLYCGLALTSRGVKVIEFNARFGDPETQVVLARLATPLGMLLRAAAVQHLEHVPELEWHEKAAVTVVLASENYPDTPVKGDVLTGVDEAGSRPDAWVLHAGTAVEDGKLVAAGGRVLSVVGTGADLTAARTAVYGALEQIGLRGGQFRTDIAEAAAAADLTERLAHPVAPGES
ncbi:phosphoribosylamine--glycine ligase [Kineosporia succinea]